MIVIIFLLCNKLQLIFNEYWLIKFFITFFNFFLINFDRPQSFLKGP